MINQKANTQTAQTLADSYNRNVAIWTNSGGQVNIQFEGDDVIEPYTILHSVIKPREEN